MVTGVSVMVLLIVVLGVLINDAVGISIGAVNERTSNVILNKGVELRIRLKRDTSTRSGYQSVHHYARHGLCRTFKGKQHFYKAMKKKICGMKMSFVANLVIDLCRHRNKLLDTWVAGLFDADGDGFITHYERHLREDSYN